MLRFIKKINWRKGGGELIGFALVLPVIMLVFCALIMATQIGLVRQSVEYITYSAARGAVICETKDLAQSAAQQIATDMAYELPGVKDVKIELINYMGNRWEKGALMKCIVTVKVDTVSPWSSSTISSSITMMVERPATI